MKLDDVQSIRFQNIFLTLFKFVYTGIIKTRFFRQSNAEKGLQAIPANSWPLHGVIGLQLSPRFPVVYA